MQTTAFDIAPQKTSALSTRVELNISCKNLIKLDVTSESDPQVKVFLLDDHTNVWNFIGQTELLSNAPNPKFTKAISLNYFFEEKQLLKFMVIDVDDEKVGTQSTAEVVKGGDLIGYFVAQLGQIVGKAGSTLTADLENEAKPGRKNGQIIVHAHEIVESNTFVRFKIRANHVDRKDMMGLGKSDPFLIIHRGNPEKTQYIAIHKTEVVMKNLDPVWKEIVLPTSKLNDNNPDLPLQFEVFDWDKDGGHDLIGSVYTTLSEIIAKRTFDIIEPNIQKKKGNKYKNSGVLVFDVADVYSVPTFLEFLNGGTEINLIIGIDFTGSNGDPNDPKSLHYRNPSGPNEYMAAIRIVGDIVAAYDPDQMFPVYGFGAVIHGKKPANHCFALNGNESNPNCFRIDGVLQTYVNSFPWIDLSGPTNFAPILNRICSLAEQNKNGEKYFILLMITDGEISDMETTIQVLRRASKLPISIIIVGVGSADFSNMETLDNDDNSLHLERDLVQFVPFRNYTNKPLAQLAKDTLAEVPQQLVKYMTTNHIAPRKPPPPQY